MSSLINRLWWKESLKNNLPGESAQMRMAPTFRGQYPEQEDPLHAAVLILLYPVDGEMHVVFMKRNEYDGPHSGQVSFPGGAREAQDLSLEQTAIRETREEIGIEEDLEILGALTPLHIPVSNFLVFPFLAWLEKTPVFFPDRSEVQYLIEVPLKELLDPAIRESETIYHHGKTIEAPYYRVGKEKIWGATAMMLSEFLVLAARMR
jgi:8-oxo-dGTP pyrophosphatase MutT (NUDIX family)